MKRMFEVFYGDRKIGVVSATNKQQAKKQAVKMCEASAHSNTGILYGQVIDESFIRVDDTNHDKYKHWM